MARPSHGRAEAYTKNPNDLKHPEPDQQVTAIASWPRFVLCHDGPTERDTAFWDRAIARTRAMNWTNAQKPVTLP